MNEQLAARGQTDTSREIWQQPDTWLDTADFIQSVRSDLIDLLRGVKAIVLTGSGSSQFAGECLHPILQTQLGIPVATTGSGAIVTHGSAALLPLRPLLLVSIARSGDSPESAAAVQMMLDSEPEVRHLIITCNPEGRLAMSYAAHPRVTVLALDERTNDRSLAMTSSFTNMVLAGRAMGCLGEVSAYRALAKKLAGQARAVLSVHEKLAEVARADFERAVYLGSGSRVGAAHECALKMLELTAGRVMTMPETYLGLRHGPMCAIGADTLVVCFVSSGEPVRSYECDLIEELRTKGLGQRVIIGENLPEPLLSGPDVAINLESTSGPADDIPLIDVVAGQLLAFHRCLREGLSPDSPSARGIITRVVAGFELHSLGRA